ncbi:enoyl-CoA hydratase [Halobacteriales archaeon QS_5_70_15]|nr:MAG: enoyl-CoA hydratase [Halobacteriales archaeon QS_5_70_15]
MPSDADLGNDDLAVTVADDGLVARATIDRAGKRNALNDAVLDGLGEVLEYADDSPVRVVLIRGAGGNFCAGGDLESMAGSFGQGAQAFREGFGTLAGLMERMVDTGALVVAAVEGYCLAGGMGLAASCDVILASEDARFGTPEVDVGLLPAQAMVPIMRTVNEKQGLKLLFTGERIDARRADGIGFTTEVVPADEFDAELDDLVDDLAASSPVMIEMGKEAFYNQREMGFSEALSYAREVIALVAMSEETEAGIEAFLTDEEPDWKGR